MKTPHTSTLIKKASQLLIRQASQLLKQSAISHAYTPFLMQLWEHDGLSQTMLYKTAGLEQSTAVRTLDRMEKENLIVRKRNPRDKRSTLIFLTPKAKTLETSILACAKTLNQQATAKLTPAEIELLNKSLLSIIENIECQLRARS